VQAVGAAEVLGEREGDDGVPDATGRERESRGRGLDLDLREERDARLLGAFEKLTAGGVALPQRASGRISGTRARSSG